MTVPRRARTERDKDSSGGRSFASYKDSMAVCPGYELEGALGDLLEGAKHPETVFDLFRLVYWVYLIRYYRHQNRSFTGRTLLPPASCPLTRFIATALPPYRDPSRPTTTISSGLSVRSNANSPSIVTLTQQYASLSKPTSTNSTGVCLLTRSSRRSDLPRYHGCGRLHRFGTRVGSQDPLRTPVCCLLSREVLRTGLPKDGGFSPKPISSGRSDNVISPHMTTPAPRTPRPGFPAAPFEGILRLLGRAIHCPRQSQVSRLPGVVSSRALPESRLRVSGGAGFAAG